MEGGEACWSTGDPEPADQILKLTRQVPPDPRVSKKVFEKVVGFLICHRHLFSLVFGLLVVVAFGRIQGRWYGNDRQLEGKREGKVGKSGAELVSRY